MDVKLIEVRDRATFISAIAIKLSYGTPKERFLMRHAGYAEAQIDPQVQEPLGLEPYVLFGRIDGGGTLEYDPYAWGGRTMPVVHQYLIKHWSEVRSGDVVDVEFILGERAVAKESEMVTGGA